MNLESIGKLLNAIAINYPRFRNDICNKDGTKIRMEVVREWERKLGYLDLDEALERLDLYMANEETSRPPRPVDLKKHKPRMKMDEWHAPIEHKWHLEFTRNDPGQMHGRVFDQEDREYVHDPTYEDGYHYDQMGRICTVDGKVVFV